MSLPFRAKPAAETLPLTLLTKQALPGWLTRAGAVRRAWVQGSGFKAAPGEICLLPGRDGAPAGALVGIAGDGGAEDLWTAAGLSGRLPEGSWRLDPEPVGPEATRLTLGWALGAYAFTRYKQPGRPPAELVWPARADRGHVERAARGAALVRDLVNTPAEDMGPAELAEAATAMARRLSMTARVIEGDALREKNFPLIHAVGRASTRAPRLIDLAWGKATHPKVTLVGKGVCFDTGGLDLKNDAGMKLMKKDMGGAAHALGLAQMVVEAKLPVRLRVLVPAVENSVSGNAFRPLDVVPTRKGISVEIGNTDAEGRLILCDALAEGASEKPAMMIDCATLTGAARVALGPDLPALFCNNDELAASILMAGELGNDPLWRMPLHAGYRRMLDSKVADINNAPNAPFAGSITAALYLKEFVPDDVPWAHIDMMAWNNATRPGRPEGGEAQAARAIFGTIEKRFSSRRA